MFDAGELPGAGRRVVEGLRACGAFEAASEPTRQALALAEETGEFVGAYRRWSGQARRTGTREEMEDELVDVIVTAFATAVVLEIDIEVALERKLYVIFHREWKDLANDAST